ncbi:MAG: SufS family cysteine desulfurase [Candidatus Pelagibacter sp. TMED118]|nr:MAG: SufS family cysteine desulfurase [Candidatus Pelagibacter sp. TMED118]
MLQSFSWDYIKSMSEIRKDFPNLYQMNRDKPLVYLDSAATSLTPSQVIQSEIKYYEKYGGSVHRSVYELGEKATNAFENSRKRIAKLIGAKKKSIIFTKSATESINLVAESWGFRNLSKNDVVLLTDMEHHSNIIPWQMICKKTGARIEYVKSSDDGTINLDDFKIALNKNVKIVSITHASNVFGTINPIKELIELAKKNNSKIMIDGCQSIPHMKVNVSELDCDFYAFSGHKMFGPTGVGVLFGKEDLLDEMEPYQTGGGIIETVTMESSSWTSIPHKFEPGSPMTAQVIALSDAADYLDNCLSSHNNELMDYAIEKMNSINGISIYGNANERTPIISFNIEGVHSLDLTHFLDFEGITIRSGHHCCQPLMQSLGISSCARASFYFYNTLDEVDFLVKKINSAIEVIK